MTLHTETMWAIAFHRDGDTQLYSGTWPTESGAKYAHCHELFPRRRINEKCWKEREQQGDRAVKVTITYEYPE